MCIKDRDLLAGSMFEHETISRIIEERCNRLLAVFSPIFLKSQANQFLVSYAQALALGKPSSWAFPNLFQEFQSCQNLYYTCLNFRNATTKDYSLHVHAL